ncbi:hypothetical protein CEXT_27261 [Caerostris extrusa]|uniref:Uncharacterized protein n=1 Tax=Caerostris extrusa TaxID=172846 RepID=A0AAV4WWG3_CAEEX|nr:hypothetical protein CEXT_27261 [Caerostris extrusa]
MGQGTNVAFPGIVHFVAIKFPRWHGEKEWNFMRWILADVYRSGAFWEKDWNFMRGILATFIVRLHYKRLRQMHLFGLAKNLQGHFKAHGGI